MTLTNRISAISFATLLACGPNTEDTSNGPVDDFPELPVFTGTNTMRFDLQEEIIPAYSESVLCYFLDKTEAELYVTAFESFQGKHGHHLIIFKARQEDTPGTVRSCASAADMANFTPVISSVNFGLEAFPDGMAIRVPKGAQIVLQQHYVNTSDQDIRVKDVAVMHMVKKEDVQILAGFVGMSDVFLELPPKQRTTIAFDCITPQDMNLLLLGPHMHEHGRHFVATLERGGESQSLIDVDWQADYRDEPPVKHFGKDTPLVVNQGDVLATRCDFENTGDETLTFPSEMCATYGYFFPATSETDEFLCAADQR